MGKLETLLHKLVARVEKDEIVATLKIPMEENCKY